MAPRPFRFGLNIIPSGKKEDLQNLSRAAEDLGYDIITVSDYLTLELPIVGIKEWTTFPPALALSLVAEATSLVKIGTYALNASLHNPALLVRDVIALQQLSGDRLELGLGAGYMKADFEAANVPWGTANERVARLGALVDEFRKLMRGTLPPILIGSNLHEGLFRLAATNADIVSTTGAGSKTEFSRATLTDSGKLTEICQFVKAAAGDRFDDIEMNCLVHALSITDNPSAPVPEFPNVEALSPAELQALPGILHGTPASIAEDLHRYRETYGFSYFTIRIPNMMDFAKVINILR
jgi:probable F420-dependent oxidoreductase